MELNYFTCTLGQASARQRTTNFTNINDYVERQADQVGDLPAVGFYSAKPSGSSWGHKVLSFREVYNGSCTIAQLISQKNKLKELQTVALLCPSSADFLFTWLALMRLGHPVLLIAPQCAPNAIAHLCKQCDATTLFYDDTFEDLVQKSCIAASDLGIELQSLLLPSVGNSDIFEMVRNQYPSLEKRSTVASNDTAYLHHTSGTSTGIPKPIPQSHRAAAGVLPRLNGSACATFTTTPLYHGGIADLFRAWTSNGLIWLFPGKDAPITAANVVKCLSIARDVTTKGLAASVKYFSSVPYVLHMMASDDEGLRYLQQMEIVGVGGAALPAQVGDDLVQKGINLISRFGSAECGFVMSSHRDYSKDREWQYLRPQDGIKYLRFEPQEEGLSELVILPGWPHMAKTNREDGSYATSDLFAPHPDIPDAWRYHSRADSQLTLITGKKFDPSPLESAIAAASAFIADVLIFGNGRPYPGALLFRSQDGKDTSNDDLMKIIAPVVEQLNAESQSHARVPRNMLIPMPFSENNLEKSSKGTILRSKAEDRYASEIESAYATLSVTRTSVSDEDVPKTVREIIDNVVGSSHHGGERLEQDTDLFAYGVDSVACVQIRHSLVQLLPKNSSDLPLTVVEDSGTIQRLSSAIIDLRHGNHINCHDNDDQLQLMQDLVEQYSQLSPKMLEAPKAPQSSSASRGKKILLTGPTGTLGSHLLSQLLSSTQISHIHLLLRGATPHAARERVMKALSSRGLPVPTDFDDRVSIHTCTLSRPQLGLDDEEYAQIAQDVDIIMHLAWSVNFLLPLRSFSQHFAGLQSLFTMALTRPSKPARVIFCSSVAAVASYSKQYPGRNIEEHVMDDPHVSGPIGYSRSKWVAENICLRINQNYPELQGRVDVVRVGQVSGDTVNGVWNKSEAYPLMLSSLNVTGCLPDLQDEHLGWIPVDVAARAFLELALGDEKVTQTDRRNDGTASGLGAFHVLNPDLKVTWSNLLVWLSKEVTFEVVKTDEWLRRLEYLQRSDDEKKRSHPCLKLLGFWKEVYGNEISSDGTANGGDSSHPETKDDGESANESSKTCGYELSKSIKAMPVLSEVKPVDEEYVKKLWHWVKENV